IGFREDVPAPIGGRRVVQGGLEVRVSVRGMIQDHVHDDLQSTLMGRGNHPLEIIVGAVRGLDLVVVRHVVPVIRWRLGNGHQPDAANTESLDVVEFGRESVEIAHAVAIGIEERSNEHFITSGTMRPPGRGLLAMKGERRDREGEEREGEASLHGTSVAVSIAMAVLVVRLTATACVESTVIKVPTQVVPERPPVRRSQYLPAGMPVVIVVATVESSRLMATNPRLPRENAMASEPSSHQ